MKKHTNYLFLLIFSLLATACNVAISDYVDAAKPGLTLNPNLTPPPPSRSTASPMFFKITPGKLNSATTGSGAINGTVTPNNRVLSLGPDMAIAVTINRSRSSAQ